MMVRMKYNLKKYYKKFDQEAIYLQKLKHLWDLILQLVNKQY